jgi:hypothetical protein
MMNPTLEVCSATPSPSKPAADASEKIAREQV